MKKIFCILLVIFNLFSVVSYAGSDYENHWAKESIDYLVKNNIVSGDASGIRPDDTITRAEFAKIANRIFNYTEESEIPFADVSPDKWYYKEMNIAKAAGYITGDDWGNSNPENNVTRAETAVMYARILSLTSSHVSTYFEDDELIPSWAKDSIYALSRAGILLGYVDGTFKASNQMTRAEVFTIAYRMIGLSEDKESEENKLQSGVAVHASSGGGGGGGSSSGGGNSASSKLSVPIIRNIDAVNKTISWDKIKDAKEYEIVITRVTTEEKNNVKITTTANTVDIADKLNALMTDKKPTEKFTVKIKAIGSSSSKNSEYSNEENFVIINPSVPLPELEISQTYNEGVEEIALVWENGNNVSGYKVEIDFGTGYQALTVEGTKCVISNELLKLATGNEKVRFQALSSVADILDSDIKEMNIQIPLYGGKEGSSNLIFNQRHFENISKNKSGSYIIAGDFTMTDYVPIEDFSGTLQAKDGCAVTVDIDIADKENVALFATAKNAVFKNITLEGTISGMKKVGGITGTDLGSCKYQNIRNYAKIISNDNAAGGITGVLSLDGVVSDCINHGEISAATSDAGGIVGVTTNVKTGSSASIYNCINKGSVSSEQRAGGIVGLLYEYITVSSCKNEGSVSATKTNCGGIAGYAYSDINDSYNAGTVHALSNAGGIAGRTDSQIAFSNCYNSGKVISTGDYAGGIAGFLGGGNCELTITNSYNAGEVASDKGIDFYGALYGYVNNANGVTVKLINCYYLTGVYAEVQDAVAVTEEELKSVNLGDSFGFCLEGSNPYYMYPQIISNPHTTGLEKLPVTPSEFVYNQSINGDVVIGFVNPESNHTGTLKITILYEGTPVSGYDEKIIAGNISEVVFSDTERIGKYSVIVVAINEEGYNSLPATFEFTLTTTHANNTFKLWLDSCEQKKDNITPHEIN